MEAETRALYPHMRLNLNSQARFRELQHRADALETSRFQHRAVEIERGRIRRKLQVPACGNRDEEGETEGEESRRWEGMN